VIKWLLIPLLGVAGLASVASGSESTDAFGVTLAEWTVQASSPTVAAGELKFETRNIGKVQHELLIVRTEKSKDTLGTPERRRYAGVYVLGQPHDHFAKLLGLKSRHIRTGGSCTDTLNLKPGKYVLYCGLPGHYEQGQRTELRVTG
jgi:uncharacterized cupredoxin-like copper-binding protein